MQASIKNMLLNLLISSTLLWLQFKWKHMTLNPTWSLRTSAGSAQAFILIRINKSIAEAGKEKYMPSTCFIRKSYLFLWNAGQRVKYWAVTVDTSLNKVIKSWNTGKQKGSGIDLREVVLLQCLVSDGRKAGLVFSLILIWVGIVLGY